MSHHLKPSIGLLSKLGSIVMHADELISSDGHHFDRSELETRLADPEVKNWLEAMGPLVPAKRNNRAAPRSTKPVPKRKVGRKKAGKK